MDNNNRWRCTLLSPQGDEAFVGYGNDFETAYKDAIAQISLWATPKKGPGIWEIKEEDTPQYKERKKNIVDEDGGREF